MIATMLILLQSSIPASVEEAKPYSPRVTHPVCPSQGDAGGDIVSAAMSMPTNNIASSR